MTTPVWQLILDGMHKMGKTQRFSTNDAHAACTLAGELVSKHQVRRILISLHQMRMIAKYGASYQYRCWAFTRAWPADVHTLYNAYISWKIVQARHMRREGRERHNARRITTQ